MNVVQQLLLLLLVQLLEHNKIIIMDLSIFPDSIGLSKNSTKELTLETIASKLTYFQEQIHLLHW